MTESMFSTSIVILVAAGISFYFLIIFRRHQKDYREHLQPILKTHGLRFVAARWPGFFKLGPFPKLEVEKGRSQSRIFGIRGEFDELRIVTFKDSGGQSYEAWANVEFELFRLRRIRWRLNNTQDLPENVKAMIET